MHTDWAVGRVAERAAKYLILSYVRVSEAGTSSAGIRVRHPSGELRQKPAGWQVDGAQSRSGADDDLRPPSSEEHGRRNTLLQLSGEDV